MNTEQCVCGYVRGREGANFDRRETKRMWSHYDAGMRFNLLYVYLSLCPNRAHKWRKVYVTFLSLR